ncbi:patatin-like phospholipase family protein [Occallatibacter riparius]|uniref:Patatin-like phospholipase family protein n=1 Tax=Occallatibacter riparius TaxID=1002689 RepID=A0A9J7BSP6_9BACT|nr:patatin-like phospholipase family protein [Occallatibacter riparius]UWZ85915.1 patatin-like phospholipase family protein [Occallatibacter riparius]
MAKHVAITIAGAVSLGSYEGGVLYELLRAIRTHNEQPGIDESRKIYIDVLTGASAGAMTAAMVAQRLMYDADALEDTPGQNAPTNSMYEAWVNKISLKGLVWMPAEPKWHSLFSSNLIQSIGKTMLVDSMKNPKSGRHPAVETVNGEPLPLRVGFALTNMNGIDYMIPFTGSTKDSFNYTTSGDQKLFTITGDKTTDEKSWQAFCHAAVASGAFPAAFRAQPIPHSPAEYDTPIAPKMPLEPEPGVCYLDWGKREDPSSFVHCDGGVLQNQPLGIAKNLVDAAVAERAKRDPAAHCDSDDRLYVFVSPHSVKSTAEDIHLKKLSILAEIRHLVNVYLRQAAFHDWITAEEMNRKITLLDQRAFQLADLIIGGDPDVDVSALSTAAFGLNKLLMANAMPQRLSRLRQQYSAQYQGVSDKRGQQAAEAYIAALATLEAAAHLENRDKMKIAAVIASEKELAGAGLAAFVGFFRKKYRQHDYWMGRVKTREYLQSPAVKNILGVVNWPEESNWTPQLANPSGVGKPGFFSIATAAIFPGIVFVLLRAWPLILLALVVWGLIHLAH